MGFNLRQKLEETFADINPFDNGATAQTVRANRAKAAPAQTVKTQTQNRPMFQQNNQPAFTQQKQFKIQTQSPTINVNNSMPKVQTFGQSSDPLKVGQVKTPQIQLQVQQPTALQITAPTAQVPAQQPNAQAPKVYTPEAQQAYTDAKIIGTGRPNEVKQAITRTVDRKNSVRLDPQFKQGKSYEDIARDAGFSIDEVKRYAERNHKGYGDQGLLGNAARATGQFVGGMVKSGTNIVARPFNDLGDMDRSRGEAELQQINRDYRSGNITPAAAMERANTLAGRYTTRKATLGDDGYIRIGNQTPIEFTGNVAQQGIDSASLLPVGGGVASGSARIASALGNKTAANTLNKAASIMTAGAQTQATSKLANALAARGINPQTANLVGNAITSNAKQSLVYGSAQTGADVASGRGITPESLAMNYGADFLMGAVPEIGLGSIGRGIDLNNTKVHQELVRTNPIYKANTDKLTAVDATIARAQANGDIRALEGLQAVKAQLSQSNALIARRYAEQGFLGGKNATGFKDAEARGEVFTDTPDGLPRFEVDDSGAKIKNPNGSTLGEVLDHPQLFKNYPELASMPVDTKNMAELAGGYMPKSKRIALDAPDKGTVLHETQHAIQDIEGADMSYAPSVYKYDDAVKILKSHETVGRELLKMADAKKQIDAMPGKRTVAERKKIAQLDEALQRKIETYKRLDAGQKDAQNTINNYNNSSIEAEARAVQARMDMPMSERYVKPQRTRPQPTDNDFQNTLPSATRPASIKSIVDNGGNPLFHDTDSRGVLGIIESGELKPSQAPFSQLAGQGKRVSTTRNFDNYSRYGKAPYRFVLDERKTGQKAIPDNREEFESIFNKPVSTKAVESIAIDITNPALIGDLQNGTVDRVIEAAKAKGIKVEAFEGKLLPDVQANKEIQEMTRDLFAKNFPELAPKPRSTFYDSLDVPKEDLIIRNDGGKAMSIEPTAALKAEALKYKSADEFIKAQGEPLYHGTNREFDKFDIGMAGQRGDVGIHGHGIYLAKQRGLAKTYADSNVRNTGVHGGGSPTIIEAYVDNAKLYDMSKNELGLTSSGKELTDQLKRAGYDGTSKDMMGGQFTEYAIFDQNKVNTKQQLTDLYNQAHTPQPKPVTQPKPEVAQAKATVSVEPTDPTAALKQEARKYKSAEEFDKFLLSRKQAGDPVALDELAKINQEAQKLVDSGVSSKKAINRVLRNYQDKITLEPEKYTSVDEFVKSQGTPLYHGTDANFKEFSLDNFGKTDDGFSGKGVYLTARKGNAKQYGKNVVESYAKLENPLVYEDSYIFGAFSPDGLRKRLGLPTNATAEAVSNELKRRGHDGIIINENTGKGIRKSEEVVVLDPNKIKTRQQLTDLYNQAHSGKAMSIEPKPKRTAKQVDAELKVMSDSPEFQEFYNGGKITGKSWNEYQRLSKEYRQLLDGAKDQPAGSMKPSKRDLRDYAKMLNDDEASQKAIGTQGLQNSKSGQRQSQGKRIRPTNQGTSSRSSQQSGQKNPLPDNKAQTGRTYPDDTPDIDTTQYVKQMSSEQKNAQKGSGGLSNFKASAKEKFIDDLAPIEDRLNKAIKDGASVDVKDHITYQLDRSRRAEGVMNAYVRDNGLDKIIQNVDNVDEFDQYLIARHAKELDEDVLTGRDIAKDAALVRQLEGKYGEKAKELYAYNQKLLDTSVDYGLISKESAAALKKQYPDYVPFNRIFNEDELANLYGGAGKGDASLSSQNVVKKIKGSNRAIASPLNSIIDKTRVVVEQGERNRAAQMLANYRELPGNPYNLKEIPKNETIGTRHTISYLDKGVKRTFETDKVIADAAKNMTRQEIGLWGRIAAVPARVLRGGATTVNIGFAGANVVKDVIGAAINSKHPFRIADPKAFGKALSAALEHDGPYYQELMREGIAGTSFDMYRNPLKSNIGEIRSHKNLGTRAAYNVTHPSQWYRTLENTIGRSEDFGRALQYYSNKSGFEAKLGKGSKDAKTLAADQARHNSTNFFRHGSAGKGINLAIPYWNAGVQGARIQTRRIAERPVQTVAKIGFAIAAPSAMIAMNNYSTPERQEIMDNIQDYEKEGNIIILGANPHMNQETGKWEDVYKIPVPPQHIGIHTAVQDAVRSAKTGEEFDVLKNLGKITQNYTTVNPTNLRETASSYTPQALKLVAEPMTNTNFFTGNPIVPESQKNLPAKDQFGDYTSGTAKILGGITNISPRQIDNAIRTGTGGAGQNALWASDKMLAGTGAIEAKDVKGQDPLTSITRRFSGAASVSASDKAENLFKKYKEQVVQSNEYKNASQYDKQRMLNRLQNDLSAVEWDKTGKSEKNLTGKQKALKSDGFDPSVYTNLDSKTANKGTPKEKYDQTLKDYNDNKANMSEVQRFKKEKELATLKVKSNFDKDVVDLWGMSKADIYGLLTKDKDGNRKANELIKLDQAMYDAGLTKYLTFKNGIAPAQRGGTKRASTGRKGTGSRGGRSRSAKGKFDYKLFGFSGSTSSNSKQLHDLLKKAQMRV